KEAEGRSMQRVLLRRRVRVPAVWGAVAVAAVTLAAISVALTAWSWGQTRDLSRSFRTLQDHLEQLNLQREAIVQLLLEKRELAEGQRVKRTPVRKHKNGRNGRNKVAAHFEILSQTHVGEDGIIKGWTERVLNTTKAVHYDPNTGTFTVEHKGLYYVYCQVHFNEKQTTYVKLDVRANESKVLQCMEGYSTTPSSETHPFHFLKPCQVSGLLQLSKGTRLTTATGASFSLHSSPRHYFGLFKVI
ncbi:TNF12 factor, partial [Atractosteus spatula]|nr:TNF12 factor [Atractosteus spatula]